MDRSAGGGSDSLRLMLREQKRECASLHAHPLFRELRSAAAAAAAGGGGVGAGAAHEAAGPPVIDDLEAGEGLLARSLLRRLRPAAAASSSTQLARTARRETPTEGQSRLLRVIQCAASERAQPAGVWAPFGRPYACLGELLQLGASAASLLPHLDRDNLAGGGQQQQQQGGQPPSSARSGSSQLRRQGLAKQQQQLGATELAPAAMEASSEQKRQELAGKLLRHKAHIRFSSGDRAEAGFAVAAVRQADTRRKVASTRPNTFFNQSLAAADLADAAGSYGACPLARTHLPGEALLQQHRHAATSGAVRGEGQFPGMAACSSGASVASQMVAVSLQQGPATNAATLNGTHSKRSSRTGAHAAGQGVLEALAAAGMQAQSSGSTVAAAAALAPPPPSGFLPLTEPVLVQQGSGLVAGWHNGFLHVRQEGFTSLQSTLHQRSRDRAAARSDPAAAAQLSRGLLQQLDVVQGRLAPAWVPGAAPESPFAAGRRREVAAAVEAASERGGGAAAAMARALQPAEVEQAERFYAALYGLVDRQRLSDPLCLTLVQRARALLGSGAVVKPPLLHQLMGAVADFANSCGLAARHNRFVLPLLRFVCACVGTDAAELQDMARAAGIAAVLFSSDLAVAAAGAGGGSAGTGSGADCPAAGQTDGASSSSGEQGGDGGCGGDSGRSTSSDAAPPEGGGNSPPPPRAATEDPAGEAAGVEPGAEGRQCSVRRSSTGDGAVGGSDSTSERRSRPGHMAPAAGEPPVAAAAAAGVPAPSLEAIELAAAAAAKEIAAAICSALSEQRAGGGSPRARVPGVAGLVDAAACPPGATAAATDAATRLPLACGGERELLAPPGLGSEGPSGSSAGSHRQAAQDEELPDLGDGAGGPLSWRIRRLEGLASWASAAGRPPGARVPKEVGGATGAAADVFDAPAP